MVASLPAGAFFTAAVACDVHVTTESPATSAIESKPALFMTLLPRSLTERFSQKGGSMAEQISPRFHAEIIFEFFNEFRDLRKVSERAAILLSGVSSDHLDAVGRYLPKDLVRVLPRRMKSAA